MLLKESADVESIVKGIFHAHVIRKGLVSISQNEGPRSLKFADEVIKSFDYITRNTNDRGNIRIIYIL